eukprot:GEMP01042053.1.p1 GENE.GEMP01042053.1~~GEMP01042053.1.p1  ORF type:complete len:321 (+),score=38.23 GEMP01042053.1:40-963(+)
MKSRSLGLLLLAMCLYFFRRLRQHFIMKEGRRRLASQRVLITGAAGGLGRAIVKAFVDDGCRKLVLWDLEAEDLEKMASPLREMGVQVDVRRCNLCEMDSINQSASIALAAGPVDVLVNNAGIVSGDEFLKIPAARMELTMKVNVMAHMWTAKAFLPKMLEGAAGSIISISSCAGQVASPRMTDYCASKFAAVGFSEALRVELKASEVSHVKVLVVCPAHIGTDLFRGADFKLPVMTPAYVAQCVVEGHLMQHSGMTTIPLHGRLGAFFVGILPMEIFDATCKFSWSAMTTFNNDRASAIFRRIDQH